MNTQNQWSDDIELCTVTWKGDLEHFRLLIGSLATSGLARIHHKIVVQTEDLGVFQPLINGPQSLICSADVLSPQVERQRIKTRHYQTVLGPRITKLLGSLTREWHIANWVRYVGWQTQQLCKLAVAAASEKRAVVFLDSDLVVLPEAMPTDFFDGDRVRCFEDRQQVSKLKGKVRNWQRTAHSLWHSELPENGEVDCYYDTPFVVDPDLVRLMLQTLEQQYNQPWWQVLLSLPPRRWSEFGTYKTFIRSRDLDRTVAWSSPDRIGYIFERENRDNILTQFKDLVENQRCRYITIHSHGSGSLSSGAPAVEDYDKALLSYLNFR